MCIYTHIDICRCLEAVRNLNQTGGVLEGIRGTESQSGLELELELEFGLDWGESTELKARTMRSCGWHILATQTRCSHALACRQRRYRPHHARVSRGLTHPASRIGSNASTALPRWAVSNWASNHAMPWASRFEATPDSSMRYSAVRRPGPPPWPNGGLRLSNRA